MLLLLIISLDYMDSWSHFGPFAINWCIYMDLKNNMTIEWRRFTVLVWDNLFLFPNQTRQRKNHRTRSTMIKCVFSCMHVKNSLWLVWLRVEDKEMRDPTPGVTMNNCRRRGQLLPHTNSPSSRQNYFSYRATSNIVKPFRVRQWTLRWCLFFSFAISRFLASEVFSSLSAQASVRWRPIRDCDGCTRFYCKRKTPGSLIYIYIRSQTSCSQELKLS